ncbi:PhlD [Streptacidiphilus sp. PAMC 29251]
MSRPGVAVPPYRVTTAEIAADLRRAHQGRPDTEALTRLAGRVGVDVRHLSRPLEQLGLGEPIEARNAWTVQAVYTLGAAAAHQALDRAGLRPGDVDCLITAHATGIAMPGLDVHLHNALGMRPDVLHLPVTQAGCLGTALCLSLAAQLVAADPARRVLVVLSEAFSTLYRHSSTPDEREDRSEADERKARRVRAMYQALFGDGASACVVTALPLGPGMCVEACRSHLLSESADRYGAGLGPAGQVWDSTPAALTAVDQCLPPLRQWLEQAGPQAWPSWVVAHPGGPRILDAVAAGLPVPEPALRHARESLRMRGNTGGPSALDVLERTYQDAPPHGEPGLLVAFGPGFTGSLLRGRWSDGAAL